MCDPTVGREVRRRHGARNGVRRGGRVPLRCRGMPWCEDRQRAERAAAADGHPARAWERPSVRRRWGARCAEAAWRESEVVGFTSARVDSSDFTKTNPPHLCLSLAHLTHLTHPTHPSLTHRHRLHLAPLHRQHWLTKVLPSSITSHSHNHIPCQPTPWHSSAHIETLCRLQKTPPAPSRASSLSMSSLYTWMQTLLCLNSRQS